MARWNPLRYSRGVGDIPSSCSRTVIAKGDDDHYRRWFRIPAQLARAGYVVVVPMLPGNAGGSNPSVSDHPDEATLDAVLSWSRTGWEHANVLMPPSATGVVGHSFGAMLGARFAVGREVSAYAGMSGGWQDWFGDEPFPLTLLQIPSLLMWGLGFDMFSPLPDPTWQQMAQPRHRIVFKKGEHWDYLGPVSIPCSPGQGPCAPLHSAAADLLTMFFGRYLPPELATDLPDRIPREPRSARVGPDVRAGILRGWLPRWFRRSCRRR